MFTACSVLGDKGDKPWIFYPGVLSRPFLQVLRYNAFSVKPDLEMKNNFLGFLEYGKNLSALSEVRYYPIQKKFEFMLWHSHRFYILKVNNYIL